MNTTDEPNTSKRIKRRSAAIVDNINRHEGYFFAPLMTADYLDELASAVDDAGKIEVPRKWDEWLRGVRW